MKKYIDVILMLFAISTNLIISVNTTSDYQIVASLGEVLIRFLWTYSIYLLLKKAFRIN
jgi:hypothetical protein